MLGPVEIDDRGPPPRPKEQAVLTVLALSCGHTVSAEGIIDAVWGDEPPRTAMHTVQGYLSRLRDRLGAEVLCTESGGYRLALPAQEVDAAMFEYLVSEGRQTLAGGDPDAADRHLAAALELWRGPPGPGLEETSGAGAGAVRLENLHLDAEELWGRAVLALGRHDEHAPDLERMARTQPLRELRWELLMVALYRSGRQAEALRAYAEAGQVLGEELGIEPGESLRDLEEAILLEAPAADHRFAVTPTIRDQTAQLELPRLLDMSGPFTFVGREAEKDLVVRAWKEAVDGLRVVTVVGEPGAGKSRLAAEVAGALYAEGALVLAGRCDEGLGVPYQPFAEAMRWFVDNGGGAGSDDTAAALAPLDAMLGPGPARPTEDDAATAQYRLFESVAEWLARLDSPEPFVLVLEDVQWATRPTLLMLRHLVHSPARMNGLVITTCRDTESAGSVGPLLSAINRAPGVDEVRLEGLDVDEVIALVEAAAGHDLDDAGRALARAVHARTEGNPLFVVELLRHLADRGALYLTDGRWTTDTAAGDIGIPPHVRDLARERVAGLDNRSAQVLQLASVVGAEFEVQVVAAVADVDIEVVVAALEAAEAAGLVVEASSRAPTTYRFTHILMQEALYEDQSAARRALSHRRIAYAIERMHGGALAFRAAQLAHHHSEAAIEGDTSAAVHYARQAADHASSSFAFDDAALWYVRALELVQLDDSRQADEGLRCDLLIALGDAQRQAGDPAHRQTLLDAASLAEGLGDADRLVRAAIAAWRGWGSSLGDVDGDKVGVLESALRAVGLRDSNWRAMLLAMLAGELAAAGADERLRSLTDEAIAVARRLNDPALLMEALNSVWTTYPLPDQHARRADAASEAMELSRDITEPRLRFSAHGRHFQVAAEQGDLVTAERDVEMCGRVAADSRGLLRLSLAASYRVTVAMLRGDLDESRRLGTQALRLSEAAGDPDAALRDGAQATLIEAEQDEFGALAEGVGAIMEAVPALEFLRATLAWALAEGGHLDRAAIELPVVVNHIQGSLAAPGIDLAAAAAKAALAAGIVEDEVSAQALYDMMLPWDGYVIGIPTLAYDGPCARFLGVLATVLGRFDAAERHFADAEALCLRMGARWFLAHNDIDFARLLLRRDEPDDRRRARHLLDRGLAAAREHGYRSVERHGSDLEAAFDR